MVIVKYGYFTHILNKNVVKRCLKPILMESANFVLSVILLPAHPASFAHKFLFQRVPGGPGMQ